MPKKYTEAEIDEFVDFLSETLIPDLKESGMEATAEDFETAVAIIEQLMDDQPTWMDPKRH